MLSASCGLAASAVFSFHRNYCGPSRCALAPEQSQSRQPAMPEGLLPSARRPGISSCSDRFLSNESFHHIIFGKGFFSEALNMKRSGGLCIGEGGFVSVTLSDNNAF